MAATAEQIADAVSKMRNSTGFRAAARRLDHVAVCMVGYRHAVPVKVGSNATKWPIRFVTSRNPEQAAHRSDLEQPLHELVTLEYVWTLSDAHARRLKAALDESLLGDDPGMSRLRHSWRDCSDPVIAWDVLLNSAIEAIRGRGESFEVMSEDMHVQRVLNEARRRR